MARDDPMMRFRAPSELKQKIEEAAAENGRSLNADILHRLEFSDENSKSLRTFLEGELEELQHAMKHLIASRNECENRYLTATDAILSGAVIAGEMMIEMR